MTSVALTDIRANGMTFRCRTAGDSGEPVVLLHGFPETTHMWIELMDVLAGAGYRCLAPDQRGYSPGARPDDVAAYGYDELVSDVFALADAVGSARFHLIGHDWGAIVGWAAVHVDGGKRIGSWTSFSIPHYVGFARATYEAPDGDLYRGILTGLMTEGVFEGMVQNSPDAFRATWTQSSPEQVADYMAVLGQPGAMRAAANWYRASNAHKRALESADAPFGPVSLPTLLLKGTKDPYVLGLTVELAAPFMTGEYRIVELDAGHWLAQEEPQRVADEVLAHLGAHPL